MVFVVEVGCCIDCSEIGFGWWNEDWLGWDWWGSVDGFECDIVFGIVLGYVCVDVGIEICLWIFLGCGWC